MQSLASYEYRSDKHPAQERVEELEMKLYHLSNTLLSIIENSTEKDVVMMATDAYNVHCIKS